MRLTNMIRVSPSQCKVAQRLLLAQWCWGQGSELCSSSQFWGWGVGGRLPTSCASGAYLDYVGIWCPLCLQVYLVPAPFMAALSWSGHHLFIFLSALLNWQLLGGKSICFLHLCPLACNSRYLIPVY